MQSNGIHQCQMPPWRERGGIGCLCRRGVGAAAAESTRAGRRGCGRGDAGARRPSSRIEQAPLPSSRCFIESACVPASGFDVVAVHSDCAGMHCACPPNLAPRPHSSPPPATLRRWSCAWRQALRCAASLSMGHEERIWAAGMGPSFTGPSDAFRLASRSGRAPPSCTTSGQGRQTGRQLLSRFGASCRHAAVTMPSWHASTLVRAATARPAPGHPLACRRRLRAAATCSRSTGAPTPQRGRA